MEVVAEVRQRSTYEFWDLDGELASAHIVDPECDPFLSSCSNPPPFTEPGPALGNEIVVYSVLDAIALPFDGEWLNATIRALDRTRAITSNPKPQASSPKAAARRNAPE